VKQINKTQRVYFSKRPVLTSYWRRLYLRWTTAQCDATVAVTGQLHTLYCSGVIHDVKLTLNHTRRVHYSESVALRELFSLSVAHVRSSIRRRGFPKIPSRLSRNRKVCKQRSIGRASHLRERSGVCRSWNIFFYHRVETNLDSKLAFLRTALTKKVIIIASVRPSVCMSASLLSFCFHFFFSELVDLSHWFYACLWAMHIARRGLKIKVIG